ncbi:hypothetical protein H8356DRAFT_938792 [Neocallimastix lanati (nom. inval.)]|jgi:hypothetical protein|uniref:Uncharacterized protein n=1 Tax=Neocallimastix californiae TaxID=1754190 RepID=A0A1Y2FE45_9FUNG|nr:hypothetical protein H8356DRAFT_938792 [Neocallimastix sp. JGI-2020a]ORY82183.1 hypothetical protein LY90DRAFT_499865 [Neocallimastix californiae]|eukprot:ORY82183.1 hypothetical protein LY90DRAFT_499865 [Neocallimastix californiae]
MSKSILKRSISSSNLKVQKHVIFNEMVSVGYTHNPENYDRSVIETSKLSKKDIEEVLKMREEMHKETQRLIKKQREIEMQILARREEESKRIASFKLAQLQKSMAKELRYQLEIQQCYQNVLNQQWSLYQQNNFFQPTSTMPNTPTIFAQSPSSVQNVIRYSIPMAQKSFPAFRPSSPVLSNPMYNVTNIMPTTLPTSQPLYSVPVNPYQKYYYGEMMSPMSYNMLIPESVI